MKLLDLLTNDLNHNGFDRQYVQLGSGLSMQVTQVTPQFGNWVKLKLQRFSQIKREVQSAELIVQNDGSFLPDTDEINTNDIISVTSVLGQSTLTEKGHVHAASYNVNMAEMYNRTSLVKRVRNRAGHWYTIQGIFHDAHRDIYTIQMQQIGADCKVKTHTFHTDGSEYYVDGHKNKIFSMHDIVEVRLA